MVSVFAYGFAHFLKPEGWKGYIKGRVLLFVHDIALLISRTLFDEQAYNDGFRNAMTRLIDESGFRYPGVKKVEHVYFHSVGVVVTGVRQGYLQEAYRLGGEYCLS